MVGPQTVRKTPTHYAGPARAVQSVEQSRKDSRLHLLCAEGSEAFEVLPVEIRNLGPWAGGPEGEVDRLRLPCRVVLGEKGFVIIH
jgi:hypothetical protein